MKNKKLFVVSISVLGFVIVSCLFATYWVYANAPEQKGIIIEVPSETQIQLKKEMENRLEMQQQAVEKFNQIQNLAFNEMLADVPVQDYFNTFEEQLNKVLAQARQEITQFDKSIVKSSSFMIEDTNKEFVVSAIVKNVKKEDLNVQIENGYLIVTAKTQQQVKPTAEEQAKQKSPMRQELDEISTFRKVVKLPKNVDITKSVVTFENDVLVIKMPKTELKEEKPVVLPIK